MTGFREFRFLGRPV